MGLGTLVGGLVGAVRERDPGESRGEAVLRSGATGLAVDAGGAAGGWLGGRLVKRPGAAVFDMPVARRGGKTLAINSLPLLLSLLGANVGYQAAKRRPEKPTFAKQLSALAEKAKSKLAAEKVAVGLNRDDGLEQVIERLKVAHARRKQAQAAKTAKTAGLGTALGGLVGLFRDKDPGERRVDAVLRSAGTGLSTDAGMVAGAALPSLLSGLLLRRRLGPSGLGAIAGGIAGYQVGKRKPSEKK